MKLFGSLSRLVSILFRKNSQDITLRPNQSTTYTAARDTQLPPGDADHVLVSAASTQTLTNKTIDGDDNTVQDLALTSLKTVLGDADKVLRRDASGVPVSGNAIPNSSALVTTDASQTLSGKSIDADTNTITNIENADIKAGAAIDAAKISSGSVSNTEFDYLDGVTSAIQTQLNAKLDKSGGTMTGAINMGSNSITSLAAPSAGSDAANKTYVDNAINGLSWKQPVAVATTANITLSGEQTIDGVLTSGSRVLVKDQTDASENGIYVSASGAWARSADMDSLSPLDEVNGAAVFVLAGTAGGDKGFVQTAAVATLDTDNVTFAQFSASTALVGGNGIDISTGTVSVDHDGEGLTFATAQLALELDGSTLSKSASGVKVASGGITNTEINASAGIDASKIGGGAVSNTEFGYLDGVTSAIQTQLGGKAGTALDNLTVGSLAAESLLVGSSSSAVSALGVGSEGQVLTVSSGAVAWAAPGSSSFEADWVTGDGTSKVVTHSLGTKDVQVQLYDKSDDSTILVDSVVRTSTSAITLTASEAPGASGWRVLVIAQ